MKKCKDNSYCKDKKSSIDFAGDFYYLRIYLRTKQEMSKISLKEDGKKIGTLSIFDISLKNGKSTYNFLFYI